jgi:hypothetical protein
MVVGCCFQPLLVLETVFDHFSKELLIRRAWELVVLLMALDEFVDQRDLFCLVRLHLRTALVQFLDGLEVSA